MNVALILVVEDHPLNLQLVRDILTYRGHEIIEANDLSEARACLQKCVPDCVLLDIQIPGGGEALLREIRRNPEWAHLVTIAVTASAMHGDRERFLAAGFDGYISKPIDTATFAAQVEGFLTGVGQ